MVAKGWRILANILFVVEVIVLLVPSSIVCAVGMFFAAAFIARSPTNPSWYFVAACVVLLAYALCSLWWLVFKHRSISISDIPRVVWVGLGLGALAALVLCVPHVLSVASGSDTLAGNAEYILGFGVGPLIVLGTVLLIMRYGRRAPPNNSSKPTPLRGAA